MDKYFYHSQRLWINDPSPLKLLVKSRQTGFTWATLFRLVCLVSAEDARLDAYVSSLNQQQADLALQDALYWAKLLNRHMVDMGEDIFDHDSRTRVGFIQFANGRRIYSLSSNPNALAGKRGHVLLDEFALHQDQRALFRTAKPVTTWGGEFIIISTPRGTSNVFYQLVRDAKAANPMGWSFHQVPIQKAVDEGLVERVNTNGTHESRPDFLKRLRAGCLDQEAWDQEYCCIASDENSAFFSYELLDACTDPNLKLLTLEELLHSLSHPSSSPPGPASTSEGHPPLPKIENPRTLPRSRRRPQTRPLRD